MLADAQKIFSFPPSSAEDAGILILGSMPGQESLRQQQYYAHPRNSFWKIMGLIFGFSPDLPYESRLECLKANRIALWDTVGCCIRPGSMDSDIREVISNDFGNFFKEHPGLGKIIFNGQTSAGLFKKHYPEIYGNETLQKFTAPSTSPAYASMSFEHKKEIWEKYIRGLR
jgi:hypoxanthine-DNA glycosylase